MIEFIDNVLNPLWKTSLPFINDGLLQLYEWNEERSKKILIMKDEMKLNDWRQVIKSKRYWNEEDKFDSDKYDRRKANKTKQVIDSHRDELAS